MRATLDTNVALGLVAPPGHRSEAARALVSQDVTLDLVLSPQSIYECYVVMTRPASANGWGFDPNRAMASTRALMTQFAFLPDPPDLVERWLDLCERYAVSGKPAHDARLAAWMEAHQVTILLTFNPGDFKRFGLDVRSEGAA